MIDLSETFANPRLACPDGTDFDVNEVGYNECFGG